MTTPPAATTPEAASDAVPGAAPDTATDPVAAEVVDLCRALVRFDTTNTGDPATSAGERAAAEWVVDRLAEVGIDAELRESAPGRASVVARIAGTGGTGTGGTDARGDPGGDQDGDPGGGTGRGALLVHGHLDVVPADPDEWRVPPFAGELADGYLWGRGTVDMKDFDAMMLAVVRHWARTGYRPPRDVVLAFTADEEAGSRYGAHFLVDAHPELLAGCTEAIGEVGGFSVEVRDDLRLYLIQIAEKGMDWLRLTATGSAGHGSMLHADNAVTAVAEAVAALGRHTFPVVLTPAVESFLTHLAEALGTPVDLTDPDRVIAQLGPIARVIGATVRHTANPTRLEAGYKENVIPGRARATVDCRSLPGRADELDAEVRRLAGPGVAVEPIVRQPSVETTFDGPVAEAMAAALRAEDPAAVPVPYMVSVGTDAKAWARLGIRCFGFSPLRLPADLDFASLFHGVDERVPVEGLKFGVRVLDRFLRTG